MKTIKPGIYQHYKGGKYQVVNEACSTEDKSINIIYHDLSDEKNFWIRPKENFLQEVELDDKKVPRFVFISEVSNDDSEKKYLRALADYQNLIKQSAKDKVDFAKYAIQDFLQEILPVYDHLKISLSNLNDQEMKNPWAVGVSHVLKQFKDVLINHGVEEIKTIGEKFDHNLMEATSGQGELVVQEIQPGYKLNGRVIRPAKVIVAPNLAE